MAEEKKKNLSTLQSCDACCACTREQEQVMREKERGILREGREEKTRLLKKGRTG